MKMVMRYFPFGDDSVTLGQIRQVPGMSGVATSLSRLAAGEVWPLEELLRLKREVVSAGLEVEVIESVNIHEDIKKGLNSRDLYIDRYIQTLRNLHEIGIKCLCYNFMPVLDWARSDLSHTLEDGSQVMAYRHKQVLALNPDTMALSMNSKARGYSLPGWEPERLALMAKDIEFYQTTTVEQYWKHIKYFLDAVIPYAQQYDIKMAIHPDDPPWPLYGLPKVITSVEHIRHFLSLNSSPYHGITFCTGSLGSSMKNDLPSMAAEFASQGRIHFAHLRNVKHVSDQDFDECAHLSSCGDLDMYAIVEALSDHGFDGYIRPDHGRMIWDEQARPGYGLYDRALGATYLAGLWEAARKTRVTRRGIPC